MDAAAQIYEMESEMIANIIKLLLDGNYPAESWQGAKIAQLGTLRKLNNRVLTDYIEKAVELAKAEILKSGQDAAKLIDSNVAADALQSAIAQGGDDRLYQIWLRWETKTRWQFLTMGATMMQDAEQKYIDTVYATTAEVMDGSQTLRGAIAETAATWSADGLGGFKDRAGRTWSTEAYAQMVIRSNIRQTVTETQIDRCAQVDHDLVEVSSHNGARPGCAPYQGRIYSLSGKTEGYDKLSDTSYGEAAGLFGINCGHRMYPYFEGAEKTYNPYSESENDEAYEESQQQRAIERSIRQAKRQLLIAEGIGNKQAIQGAKDRIAQRQAAMRDFIDDTGRTRRRDREQIYQ